MAMNTTLFTRNRPWQAMSSSSCRFKASSRPRWASAASGAVSARSTRAPNETGRKPAARAAASSVALRPPSGPLSSSRSPEAATCSRQGSACSRLSSRRRGARGQVGQPDRQRQRRRHRGHPVAATLLTGRHRHRLPVLRLALGALARQAQHRTLAHQRLDRGHAELGGLFHQRIHAVVGGHAQRQRHRMRQFALLRLMGQRLHPHRVAAHVRDLRLPLATLAVEQRQGIARLQAQHLHMARGHGFEFDVGASGKRLAGVDAGNHRPAVCPMLAASSHPRHAGVAGHTPLVRAGTSTPCVAQFAAQDLAHRRLRQVGAELHHLRPLVAGEVGLAIGAHLGLGDGGVLACTITAFTASPAFSSGMPTAAHSRMPGICVITSSTSLGYTLKPLTRIMSFLRSTILK